MGMPSIHSVVRTRAAVRDQSTAGTRKFMSFFVRSANSDAAAASMRRSSSSATDTASVCTTPRWAANAAPLPRRVRPRTRGKRKGGNIAPRIPAPRRAATLSPPRGAAGTSLVSASWTCAMDAAATASENEMRNNASSGLLQCARATTFFASAVGNGGKRSCKPCNASATSSPTRSGRVASTWPEF